jgi:hypothetical protein
MLIQFDRSEMPFLEIDFWFSDKIYIFAANEKNISIRPFTGWQRCR